MTTQLLIYEKVVPLSFGRHRDSCVDIGGNYSFSGKVNSVPLMAIEFPLVARLRAVECESASNFGPAPIGP